MQHGYNPGQDDVAVVIGISCYEAGDTALGDLPGAVHDAIRFSHWLRKVGGVPKNNIIPIISPRKPPSNGKPIMDQVQDALEEALMKGRKLRQLGRNPRRLYMYFAGHGFSHAPDHVAILMANATQHLRRAMNMDDYHTALMSISPFSEQVFLYDCCRRWDMQKSGAPNQWSSPPQQEDYDSNDVTQYIYLATGFKHASYETKEPLFSSRRGFFTMALLEGLEGAAAICRRGKWLVTTTTLGHYVAERLRELTIPHGLRQQPYQMLKGPQQPLILAYVNPPDKGHVTIRTDGGLKSISILDASGMEVQFQDGMLDRTQAEVQIDLPAGLYYLESSEDNVTPILIHSGKSLVVPC